MAAPMIKPSHEGREHRRVGVPAGKKISAAKLMDALKKDKREHNVRGEREDVFAMNFGHKRG